MKKWLALLLVVLIVWPVLGVAETVDDSLLEANGRTDGQIYLDCLTAWSDAYKSYRWNYYDGNTPADRTAIRHIVEARDKVEAAYWTLWLKQQKKQYSDPLPSENAFYALQARVWEQADEAYLEQIKRNDPTANVGEGRDLTAEELAMFPPELGTIAYARVYGETVHVQTELGGTTFTSSEELNEWEIWVWDQKAKAEAAVGKNSSSLHCYDKSLRGEALDARFEQLDNIVAQLSDQLVASNADRQDGTVSLRAQVAAQEKLAKFPPLFWDKRMELDSSGFNFAVIPIAAGGSTDNIKNLDDFDAYVTLEEGTPLYELYYGEGATEESWSYVELVCMKEAGLYDGELPTVEEFMKLLANAEGKAAQ